MAARLQGPHERALNHFVTNSPWGVAPVRRRIARRVDEALVAAAWVADDMRARLEPSVAELHLPLGDAHRRAAALRPGKGTSGLTSASVGPAAA